MRWKTLLAVWTAVIALGAAMPPNKPASSEEEGAPPGADASEELGVEESEPLLPEEGSPDEVETIKEGPAEVDEAARSIIESLGLKDADGKPVSPPLLRKRSFGFRLATHLRATRPGRGFVEDSRSERKRREALDRTASSFRLQLETVRKGGGSFFQCQDQDCSTASRVYRSADGGCNNLRHPEWGRSGTPQRRELPRKHSLIECGKARSRLPNARLASRLLADRKEKDDHSKLSIYVMTWGQLIDHDIVLSPVRSEADGSFLDCCEPQNRGVEDCCSIQVPRGDFFYGRQGRPSCIPLLRSRLSNLKSCGQILLPDVENGNTAWVDASFLYGSTKNVTDSIRSFSGGRLRTSVDNRRRHFPHISSDGGFRMLFGDTRGDVHPPFTLLLTSTMRYHNMVADKLASMHPNWGDEKLYQEARKITSAIIQHITYTQFLDSLLGVPNDVSTKKWELHRDYYRQQVDPRISVVFSTAAYRLHTYVAGEFDLKDPRYRDVGELKLRDIFHQPLKLLQGDHFDDLIRGQAAQPLKKFNNVYSTEMTEWLFKDSQDNFGMDIVAINTQRGRDHQIQGYPEYREFCGLGSVESWEDMTDLIPNDLVHRLLHTYRKPDDVDMYIAGSMEWPLVGSILGPTTHCLVRDQFQRLRDGDRFFYTRPGVFTTSQLKQIKGMTLASLLCMGADEPQSMWLPTNVFNVVNGGRNPAIPCSDHHQINFNAWN